MRKPQISLLTVSVTVASLLLASTTSFAAHKAYKENYKGEVPCPVELVLKDGLYVGLQAGYDSYRTVADINAADGLLTSPGVLDPNGYIISTDPRLNSTGAVGGGFIGFGKYFDNMYGAYLGLEIFGNWSGAQTSNTTYISQQGPVLLPDVGNLDVLKTSFEVNSNYGISVLPGIKLNNATLMYVRLGYNWANVESNVTIGANMAAAPNPALNQGVYRSASGSDTIGGFNYGLGIESTFADNWSVRAEYSHTDFNSVSADTLYGDNDFTSANNQFMLGLVYHINM
jgi:opacity protein-like surface antigen